MIASLCTIQMPFIVTQISLILLEKSPAVRSWIPLYFLNISVGFSKYKLNSDWIPAAGSPREVRGSNPSGGPFSQYFENFKNSISWITVAGGKVVGIWYLLGWRADREESESAIKNTFFFIDGAPLLTHTLGTVLLGCVTFWPRLGLWCALA